MIQSTRPSELVLINLLETMLVSVRMLQRPHNLFKAQSKRMRRCVDNIEDSVLEGMAILAGVTDDSRPWSKVELDRLASTLGPSSSDIQQLHNANHEQDEVIWAAWGPPSDEVRAYMAVEALVAAYEGLGAAMTAQSYVYRMMEGFSEEESKERLQKVSRGHSNIQIVGDLDQLPKPLRDMLRRLGGDE